MANFMQWLSEKRLAHKEKKARAKQEMMERKSYSVINVVEFNGKLFVSHNGIPIVAVSNLSTDVEKVVANSRKDYLAWENKFGKEMYEKI